MDGLVISAQNTPPNLNSSYYAEAVSVLDYGAKCDGKNDDTSALQVAINAGIGKLITLPSGHCLYTSLVIKGTGTSLVGKGRSSTYLQQTNSTGDGIYIGDPATPGSVINTYNYSLAHMTIYPSTPKTSGFAVHIHNVIGVYLFDIETGNDLLNAYGGGNRNFGGIWVDYSGSVHLEQTEIWAQADVFRINDSVDSAIHYTNLRYGTIGLHMAGGVAGFHCTQSNIESNVNNMYVDNSIDGATPNHVNLFGTACSFDSSSSDNIVINTPLGGLNQWVWNGASIATQNGAAVNVISAPNYSNLIFNATPIGSYSGSGTGDGIKLQDSSVTVQVSGSTQIYGNTGYGVRETYSSPTPNPVYIDVSTIWSIAGRGNTLGNTNFSYSTMCPAGFTCPGR